MNKKREICYEGAKGDARPKSAQSGFLFELFGDEGLRENRKSRKGGTGREKTQSAACLASRKGKRKSRKNSFFFPFCFALAPRPGLGLDSFFSQKRKKATPAGPRRRESTKNELEIGDGGTWVRPENGAADVSKKV